MIEVDVGLVQFSCYFEMDKAENDAILAVTDNP